MIKLQTPYDVRTVYNDGESGHFFDEDTMEFFGDTMNSFELITVDNELYMYRKPWAKVNVFGKRKTVNEEYFNAWLVVTENDKLDLDSVSEATRKYLYSRVQEASV